MGQQALCIPAAGCCGDFHATRACVTAGCTYDGGGITPPATTGTSERIRRLRTT
jgi:hypothetical protein